jgi:DNA-directed RNA polymerase specialized sigma24 family protein
LNSGKSSSITSFINPLNSVLDAIDLDEFLTKLSNEERSIFLKGLGGYTYAEIASDVMQVADG